MSFNVKFPITAHAKSTPQSVSNFQVLVGVKEKKSSLNNLLFKNYFVPKFQVVDPLYSGNSLSNDQMIHEFLFCYIGSPKVNVKLYDVNFPINVILPLLCSI